MFTCYIHGPVINLREHLYKPLGNFDIIVEKGMVMT